MYELLYIIPSKYSEKEREEINKKIVDLIKENEGIIENQENLGEKKLAYKIKHCSRGYYLLINFDLEPEKLEKIDKTLKMTPEILRHLIIKREEKREKVEKPRKISLEELDKKLEEITKI